MGEFDDLNRPGRRLSSKRPWKPNPTPHRQKIFYFITRDGREQISVTASAEASAKILACERLFIRTGKHYLPEHIFAQRID